MHPVSRDPRVIFDVFKQQVIQNPEPSTLKVRCGQDESYSVLDRFEASVPGAIFGKPGETVSVTIYPSSKVDNKPETNDLVYFSIGDNECIVSEDRHAYNGLSVLSHRMSVFKGHDGYKDIGNLARLLPQ